jgi:hypothetical protein
MKIAIACIALLSLVSMASAQCLTPESSARVWDYGKDVLIWEFKSLDPPPTAFRLFVSQDPGVPLMAMDVPPTSFEARIASVLPGLSNGQYYLAVAPMYGSVSGEKGPECPFV